MSDTRRLKEGKRRGYWVSKLCSKGLPMENSSSIITLLHLTLVLLCPSCAPPPIQLEKSWLHAIDEVQTFSFLSNRFAAPHNRANVRIRTFLLGYVMYYLCMIYGRLSAKPKPEYIGLAIISKTFLFDFYYLQINSKKYINYGNINEYLINKRCKLLQYEIKYL